MKNWTQAAETAFAHWARWMIRGRWVVLALSTLLFGLALTQLPKLQMDTSTEGFFHEDDPALINYEAFKAQFGSDKAIVLMIRPTEVFDLQTLQTLTALHADLERELPYLDEVISLVNITSVRGEADELIVEDLLEVIPQTPEELALLKERVLSNPLYRDQIISEDGRLTAMVIRPNALIPDEPLNAAPDDLLSFESGAETPIEDSDLLSFETTPASETEDLLAFDEGSSTETGYHSMNLKEEGEFMNVVRTITDRYRAENFQLYLGGMMVMESTIMGSMVQNMPRFTITALILIMVLLGVVFRRISGVILPLLTVVVALLSTVGLMAWLGIPFTIFSQILPSFLLAVGIGYSVHLLTIFFQQLQQGDPPEEALVESLRHSGLAILITSLTTAGGLLSFAGAGLAPIGDLGTFGAIGVLIAVAFTLGPLPALLAVLPIQPRKLLQASAETDSWLVRTALYSIRHPRTILLVSLVALIVSLLSALKLNFDHNPIAWMPPGHDLRVSNEAINAEMKGASVAEIVVRANSENALKTPEWMNALEQFNRAAEATVVGPLAVGKSTSMADTLKQIHRALNEDREEFYSIPADPELIAQELLLFENSGGDDLERQVNPLFTTARITVKMPWVNANVYSPVLQDLRNTAKEVFGPLGEFRITGMVVLLAETVVLMIESMLQSYLIAGVVITILMILVLGSLRQGLLSMVPNFLPIVLGLGVMHAVGLPLDAMSILVGSIALGLAVDDTIHFFHHFQRYYRETGNPEEAVRRTMNTTGKAMLFTSVVLSIGFFTYILSEMNNLFSFGLITGLTILFAFLADLLVAPALMGLLYHKRSLS